MVMDQKLLEEVTLQAKASPRLRMNRRQAERIYKLVCSLPRREGGKAKLNYNFHHSPDELCHRMLNAVEPGTEIPIHRHPEKVESFVILRGKVRSTTYNDDGSVFDSVVLSQEDGIYGVDIPKGVWHKLESLEPASVIFECKSGPYVPHEVEGVLTVHG